MNNLIGSTMNPVNQLLSCGGSSGGEGALLALGGSTIGVGTDIGSLSDRRSSIEPYTYINRWFRPHSGVILRCVLNKAVFWPFLVQKGRQQCESGVCALLSIAC